MGDGSEDAGLPEGAGGERALAVVQLRVLHQRAEVAHRPVEQRKAQHGTCREEGIVERRRHPIQPRLCTTDDLRAMPLCCEPGAMAS